MSTVYAPKGSGANGIAWADVEAKYRAQTPKALLQGQRVEASLGMIHDLQREATVAILIDLLDPEAV
jgi:hypothetical protein